MSDRNKKIRIILLYILIFVMFFLVGKKNAKAGKIIDYEKEIKEHIQPLVRSVHIDLGYNITENGGNPSGKCYIGGNCREWRKIEKSQMM